MVGVTRGVSKRQACFAIVNQTRLPLLASTLIAILAFTPFGLSDSDTGQIMKAMFWVLTYSLFLSWILAISLTPFLVDILMRDVDSAGDVGSDPYQGLAYTVYRKILTMSLHYRKTVIVIMVSLLALSLYGIPCTEWGT
jgi:multidrug efflux pump subunit AcrB